MTLENIHIIAVFESSLCTARVPGIVRCSYHLYTN